MKTQSDNSTTTGQAQGNAKNNSCDCNYDNDYYGDQLCIEKQHTVRLEHTEFAIERFLTF